MAYPMAIFMLMLVYTRAQKFGEAKLMYEWKFLEFQWPSETEKENRISDGSYVVNRSLLTGIKVYKDKVYLTIPRWMWTSGHPVTLAKVVTVGDRHTLAPYPSWAAQKQGDCDALQYVQSMEIDPNTGRLYAVDTGRVGDQLNLCPAKIVVYDLNTHEELGRYVIEDEAAGRTSNFLNDVVLDYIEGRMAYAYITNTMQSRITVYDFRKGSAHYFEHPSMEVEGDNASVVSINGEDYNFSVAIDGIAMSPDFRFVYYCVLGGYNLYQVPVWTLRTPGASENTGVRLVGKKISQTDGLAHGSKHLFYGALGLNAVYYWDSKKDIAAQDTSEGWVTLATQVELIRNNKATQWPDTFAFDERGWIWFVSNRLQDFWGTTGIPAEGDAYMRVWKVFVNETSYLHKADERTTMKGGASNVTPLITWCGYALCIAVLTCLTAARMSFFNTSA
ncbi:hypothetical protein BsWGS_12270 [Bradybaena similaris]